jgi:hypothetical protein
VLIDVSALVRDSQHTELGWWDEAAVLASDPVYPNAKACFG